MEATDEDRQTLTFYRTAGGNTLTVTPATAAEVIGFDFARSATAKATAEHDASGGEAASPFRLMAEEGNDTKPQVISRLIFEQYT